MTSYQRRVQNKVNTPLTRKLDFEGLVRDGIAAIDKDRIYKLIREADGNNHIDLAARLTIQYPDDDLCSARSDREHYDDIALFSEHFVSAWYAMAKSFSLHFTSMIHYAVYAALATWSTTSGEDLEGRKSASLQITLPCYDEYAPRVLEKLLLRAVKYKALQVAKSASLQVSMKGKAMIGEATHLFESTLFDKEVKRLAIDAYLQASKLPETAVFFSHPRVAELVARACRGYRVTCDEAIWNAEPRKRCNIARVEVQIDEPGDVTRLATEERFCAFYPRSKIDKHLGRLVIDLDVQPGLVRLAGKQMAWAITCAVSDAIVAAALASSFPVPARHLSGSKGIHVIWELDDAALDIVAGVVNVPPYVMAIKAVDARLGAIKSDAKWLTEASFVARKLLEAIILHAMYTAMARNEVLTDEQRFKACIPLDRLLITLDKESDADGDDKISIDSQPTCYRWFSPHYKTGWVARSIVDANGDIIPKYRDLDAIAADYTMEATLAAIDAGSPDIEDHPGIVTNAMLCQAAAALGGELWALTIESEKGAWHMTGDEYRQHCADHEQAIARAAIADGIEL